MKNNFSKKKIKRFAIFALVALVFIVLIILVSGKKKTVAKAENLPVVVVQKPERKNLSQSVTISGYVEAKAMIPVVPFVSGNIQEYPAKAGDFVKKDTLLAKIDDAPFRQQMLQAQAAYLAAKSTYERVDSLYKSGATTQQNYDNAKAQYDASSAQYDLAKLQMDYTEVKAPVDGTILIADQAVGATAAQGTPLAVLADLTNQVVRLKVPEKYFDLFTMERENLVVTVIRPAEKSLGLGSDATAGDKTNAPEGDAAAPVSDADAPATSTNALVTDAKTSATIENIAPYVSPESKTFEVVCHLDQPGQRFRPGMFVKVQVAYKTYQNVPVLPIQTKKMDGSFYIYDSENQTVHFVMPENTPDDGEYFIVDEKYADSFFVTDGQNFIFDGQKVKLYEDAKNEVFGGDDQ